MSHIATLLLLYQVSVLLLEQVRTLRLLSFLAYDALDALDKPLLLHLKLVPLPDEVGGSGLYIVLLHAASKQTQKELVIRFLFKLERSTILHVILELSRTSLAQRLNRGLLLLLFDGRVLLVLVLSRQPLPRKLSLQKVEENVSDAFKVITPTLLLAQVCV